MDAVTESAMDSRSGPEGAERAVSGLLNMLNSVLGLASKAGGLAGGCSGVPVPCLSGNP